MYEKIYIGRLIEILDALLESQSEQISCAVDIVARSVSSGGVIHVFGTGHSSILAQEPFMRAGGLLPVNAMLDERVLLSAGSLSSSVAEKQEGLAVEILGAHDIRPEDAGLIISNSGRNAAPIEMASEMKEKGIPVIAITSIQHSSSVASSHTSGKKLMDIADVVLDNRAPHGDAIIELSGAQYSMGPISTVTGAALINSVIILATEKMIAEGADPLVLPSGNIETADFTQVQQAMQEYIGRIKYL